MKNFNRIEKFFIVKCSAKIDFLNSLCKMLSNKVEVLVNTFIVTEEALFISNSFLFLFLLGISSLFLLLYVPEYIRLITSVCAHMEESV